MNQLFKDYTYVHVHVQCMLLVTFPLHEIGLIITLLNSECDFH